MGLQSQGNTRYPPNDLKKWLTEEDLKAKRPKMEKQKQQDER
jgi:hypothetical protein